MKSKIMAVSSFFLALSGSAIADHSWGDYHWARTTSSFDLIIINSTTPDWDGYVSQAVSDWSASTKLNMIEDLSGDSSSRTRRKCNAPDGMVRICNLAYGQTGWLGIAGISLDAQGHITRGYTKLNDTYFASGYYNNDVWKQSVTCQELGHNVGLDHQDEDFNNGSLYTCMDYQDPPYAYPNAHDYEQLVTMYTHTDSYDSYIGGGNSGGGDGGCNAPKGKGCNKSDIGNSNSEIGWGYSLGRRGNSETFIRIDPDGTRHLTHVTWAKEHVDDHQHEH
ncbi:hypothetical protein V1358_09450 [Pseudoalteromonas sp. YIC-656]|uniref:hypothetical protein n=1 Tax=Pseudoalteromonas pernae TaxID=3118054 RepID=UPI003242C704